MSQTNLADLLFLGDEPAEHPFVHWRGRTFSRGEIARAADALAARIRAAGATPGTAVSALVPSSPAGVAMLFAVWRAGAVCAPVNPRLPEPVTARIIADVQPSVIVEPPNDVWSLDARVIPSDGIARKYDADVALVMTTSGTTGPPKRVLLAHASVLASIDSALHKIRGNGSGGDRPPRRGPPMPNLVPMPLALWAGVFNTLFAARVGSAVLLLHPFSTQEFVAAVRQFGLKSTVLAPAMMTMLLDDTAVTSLAPLRFVRSGTAPLSPHEARRFHERFGVTVLNGYGQTELGGEIAGWNADDVRTYGEAKLGAVGRPHEGIEIRIVASDDADAPVGEPGEIWVRSPFVMRGYASDERELDARLDEAGFLRTGDIGHLDHDGFLWIDGRVSDLINRGGLKIYPSEVEEVLRADPAVADACVAGVPDRRLGEVPWAWIVAARDAVVDRDVLAVRCREQLAPYAVPVRFEIVDELPRNDVGKVLRKDLVTRAIGATAPTGTESRGGDDPSD